MRKISLNILLYFLCVLIVFLPSKSGIVRYTDEMATIIFFLYVMILVDKKKDLHCIKVCCCFMVAIGFLFSIASGLNQPLLAVCVDLLSLLKYPMAYLYFRYGIKEDVIYKFVNFIIPIIKIVTIVAFVCMVINNLSDIGMTFKVRYGIKSFKFIYNNPGTFNVLMIFCYSLLTIKEESKIFRAMCLLCMLMTVRVVAIATVALTFALFVFKTKKKIKISHVILLGILVIILGFDSISNYFFSGSDVPRARLWVGCFSVFKEYFPLGAGAASFGSDMAYKYYSPLYVKLGYNYVWGFNPTTGHLVNDNYWPMIIAQFGLVGLFLNVRILSSQIITVIKNNNKSIFTLTSTWIVVFIMGVCESVGSAVYTSERGIIYGMLLGIIGTYIDCALRE